MKVEESFKVAEWLVVKITLLILLIAGALKVIAPEIGAIVKLFK